MKKKRLLLLCSPLILLALLTFIRPSLINSMTPKVRAEKITSGSINVMLPLAGYQLHCAQLRQIELNRTLSEALSVTEINGASGKQALEGQPLVRFDIDEANRQLIDARLALANSEDALFNFDMQYAQMSAQAEKNLQTAQKEMDQGKNASEKRKNELLTKLQSAQHAYDLLITQGIMNGSTREKNELYVNDAKEKYQALLELSGGDGWVLSPCDGYIVSAAPLKEGQKPKSGEPLFSMIPVNEPYNIIIEMDESIAAILRQSLIGTTMRLIPEDLTEPYLSVRYAGLENIEADRYNLFLTPLWEGFDSLEKLAGYQLQIQTPFYSMIIPKSAFINENTVYAVTQDQAGNSIVRQYTVKTGARNSVQAAILSGLSNDMEIVTGWDRALSDGQKVVLQE